ncbi:ATP-binding protein [Draconibacterium sp.]|nr:ATP-binding protein [Draconibacterium sp.]
MTTELNTDFTMQLVKTELDWDDLVLQEKTLSDINDIKIWLKHNQTFLDDWKMKKKIKPGYRVLFYGPPGTGKTLTASLLGKYTGKDVYKVDLSLVVSKYIGETEKNLANLFNKAENKDWILFFDEADALFGKRTQVKETRDKYANQEVSYLLQRIERYEGMTILSSNNKANIDPSITRRFNSIIKFKKPGVQERLRLWEKYIPPTVEVDKKILLKEIAKKYDITGANIVNVIHYAGLKAIEKNVKTLESENLIKGIQKEYLKEGKSFRKK